MIDASGAIAEVRVGPAFSDDSAPAVRYTIGDHLGSCVVVADDTGTWVNREEFTPYGETSLGSFARKRYRFTGKSRDAESGLNYHGGRYCASWLARWTSCDPLLVFPNYTQESEDKKSFANRLRTSQSLFAYSANSPMAFIDPDGKQEVDPKVAEGIQSSVNSLVNALSHGTSQASYEAAISEAQLAELFSEKQAGKVYQHLTNINDQAGGVRNAMDSLDKQLKTLDPRVMSRARDALRPLLQKASDILTLNRETNQLIEKIRQSGFSQRLAGVPFNPGDAEKNLMSQQLARRGIELVPNAIANAFSNTLERIRQLPMSNADAAEKAKQLGVTVAAGLQVVWRSGAAATAASISRAMSLALSFMRAFGGILFTPILVMKPEPQGA